MHLTLRQLRYFVSSVDAGSISRAAEDLRVAPTALSQQIKAIEDGFAGVLLDRHSRGIVPTAAVRELYERARRILDLVSETEAVLSRMGRVPERHLTLGMPPAIAGLLGGDAMIGAAKRFRNLRVDIVEGWSDDLFERLLSRDVDVMVGYGLPQNDQVTAVDLVDERFVFAAAPSMSPETGPIDLRDALAFDLVFYGRRSVGARTVHAAAASIGAPVHVRQEVTSMEVWRDIITRGICATVVPVCALRQEMATGAVVVRDIVGGPVQLRVALAARNDTFRAGMASGVVPFLQDLVRNCYLPLGRFATVLPRSPGSHPVPASAMP